MYKKYLNQIIKEPYFVCKYMQFVGIESLAESQLYYNTKYFMKKKTIFESIQMRLTSLLLIV